MAETESYCVEVPVQGSRLAKITSLLWTARDHTVRFQAGVAADRTHSPVCGLEQRWVSAARNRTAPPERRESTLQQREKVLKSYLVLFLCVFRWPQDFKEETELWLSLLGGTCTCTCKVPEGFNVQEVPNVMVIRTQSIDALGDAMWTSQECTSSIDCHFHYTRHQFVHELV